ncbi:GntR family transcriptional regulator [Skermanella stibiiresistens SB22]|uniref:Pyruvate dehydrogenase complex repressor n=1 Tax=Skermanella stibiiresistens SB22 TaxID=1385369 RepID=W9GSC8_9PROT|nr:FCD domain-containing protein [Skermanella stibiiresistens]EWY36634.1 GntR family transcriptional regulator [Skermanella stibiiresistens SB22]
MTEPIRPAKLADAIADRLEHLILEGSLRPGERLLPERELALRFDVSRPSLREALEKLEKRGLLTSGRGGATRVAPLLDEGFTNPLASCVRDDPEATYDYLEFRGIAESSAAYLAALRGTEVDRELIRECFAAMEEAHQKEDPTDEANADADFHLAIYEASHNLFMLHVMRSLSGMLRNDVFYNRSTLYLRRNVRELLLGQHRAIHDGIVAGDPEKARQAAHDHMIFTSGALKEIAKADARLEVSINRIARADAVATPPR